jgi:hypothetical protein
MFFAPFVNRVGRTGKLRFGENASPRRRANAAHLFATQPPGYRLPAMSCHLCYALRKFCRQTAIVIA